MSDQENETEQNTDLSPHALEKLEEAKLKAKYPSMGPTGSNNPAAGGGGRVIAGHSVFLQKRLAKGQKYFDSGDYQMAKQKMNGGVNKQPTKVPTSVNPYATGDAIPTPDSVPARKTSIVQPSKLTSNVS